MDRRHFVQRLLLTLPFAAPLLARLPAALPRIQHVTYRAGHYWGRLGGRVMHVASPGPSERYGRLAEGARFVRYGDPRRTGWQGWIENARGEVVGWVNLNGQAIPHEWVR